MTKQITITEDQLHVICEAIQEAVKSKLENAVKYLVKNKNEMAYWSEADAEKYKLIEQELANKFHDELIVRSDKSLISHDDLSDACQAISAGSNSYLIAWAQELEEGDKLGYASGYKEAGFRWRKLNEKFVKMMNEVNYE